MYDIEKIIRIIKDIENFERELKEMNVKSANDLGKSEKKHAVSMVCFAVLNRAIDLGQEILIKEEYSIPSKYGEIFTSLSKAGVMNIEEAKKMNELIDLRNVIAHTYFELTNKQLMKIVDNINLIDKFIEKVKKRVKQNGKNK